MIVWKYFYIILPRTDCGSDMQYGIMYKTVMGSATL